MVKRAQPLRKTKPVPTFMPATAGSLWPRLVWSRSPALDGGCADGPSRRVNLQHRATNHVIPSEVPTIVHEVLDTPGQPLDSVMAAFMESRFGHDFGRVRIHADDKATESARAVKAHAYALGDDVVFGSNQYAPTSARGIKLLAHELAHVVQQRLGGGGQGAEQRAEAAAKRVAVGQLLGPDMPGGASFGLYKQREEETERRRAPMTSATFAVNWDELSRPGAFQLSLPSLTMPLSGPPSLGLPSLRQPTLPLPAPSYQAPQPWLTPPPMPSQPDQGAPQLPSRLPVVSRGSFSLGLRLGFPEAEARALSSAPESSLKATLQRAEIMNQILTGQIPSGWEELDKGKLAQAVWGIFSTHIAPNLARKITSGLASPISGGTSFQLDLVLLTDLSGGGLSFNVSY